LKTTLRLFGFLLFYFTTQTSIAQNDVPPPRCGTVEYYKKLFQSDAGFQKRLETNRESISKKTIDRGALRITAVDDTITLAIHIIGSSAMQALVTNAVIQSQIDVLNEDYQGKNADSTRIPCSFKPLYGKSKLTFALAGTNPFGEPTTGINRLTNSSTYDLSTIDNAKFTATGWSRWLGWHKIFEHLGG
jgi:hypothetical protein